MLYELKLTISIGSEDDIYLQTIILNNDKYSDIECTVENKVFRFKCLPSNIIIKTNTYMNIREYTIPLLNV